MEAYALLLTWRTWRLSTPQLATTWRRTELQRSGHCAIVHNLTGEGHGTKFTSANPCETAIKVTLPISVSGKRVLIVEDEFSIAQSLSEDLAEMGGIIVGFAANPARARSILDTRVGVDLVIVDWELGDETSAAIVQSLSDRGATVILMTAHATKLILRELQHLP